jgi:hypothetical protein
MMFEFTHGSMKGHVHTCFPHWPMTLEPFDTITRVNAWGIFHWSSNLLKLFQLILIYVRQINICVCPFTYISHEKMHGEFPIGHLICPICHHFARNNISWQKHFITRCLKSNHVVICPLYFVTHHCFDYITTINYMWLNGYLSWVMTPT